MSSSPRTCFNRAVTNRRGAKHSSAGPQGGFRHGTETVLDSECGGCGSSGCFTAHAARPSLSPADKDWGAGDHTCGADPLPAGGPDCGRSSDPGGLSLSDQGKVSPAPLLSAAALDAGTADLGFLQELLQPERDAISKHRTQARYAVTSGRAITTSEGGRGLGCAGKAHTRSGQPHSKRAGPRTCAPARAGAAQPQPASSRFRPGSALPPL